ncbi:hypothetical protein [Azovibrio sp.]|uniref:hypothetical protein n=1 Tax=Azovibrio sp. TaxID=1872673 RepID=UPI003C715E97
MQQFDSPASPATADSLLVADEKRSGSRAQDLPGALQGLDPKREAFILDSFDQGSVHGVSLSSGRAEAMPMSQKKGCQAAIFAPSS